MNEPIAYLNGKWIPFSSARLSVADYGVVQAATVTEMLRTFRHRPFRISEHLNRLRNSLIATGIADPSLVDELPTVIDRVVEQNAQLISKTDELNVAAFITAGIHPIYSAGSSLPVESPTVCVHSFLLSPGRWLEQYRHGASLVIPSVQAVSPATIDPRIKYRSRLHWFLADQEARRNHPGAMALLVDAEGHLTETSSGNILLYDGDVLRSPRAGRVLDGVSQRMVIELAAKLGIQHRHDDLTVSDLQHANEVFLSSTSYCLLPVTRVDGAIIGTGVPGPLYQRLIDDWSQIVEVDITGQMAHRQASAGHESAE